VGLKAFLMKGKLQRAEREAKRLHGMQKRVRGHIDELEAEHRKGGMDEATYKDRKAKLEAKRHEYIEKLKEVEVLERQLRADLKALEASA
jgi:chromosome segregation ATPase